MSEVVTKPVPKKIAVQLGQGEDQVGRRIRLAAISGVTLLAAKTLSLSGNEGAGAVFSMLACLLIAVPIFGDAWRDLNRGDVGFPSLVALAFAACLSGEKYEMAGLVGFFMILSDQLKNRTAIGAHRAIETLIRETPDFVHVEDEEAKVSDIPLSQLSQGQVMHIRPGEILSADGEIIEGSSSFDESSMTGESHPVDKQKGSGVYAGTINLTGLIRVKVQKVGDDTTVGRVKELILSAANSKLPLISVMEKNAGWYTPMVLMISLLVYYCHRGAPGAMERAIAVLITACPFGLILAAPSAMIAAITSAARSGVLVKNAVELEYFHRIDHIFFDKTGTLTTGEMNVTHYQPKGGVSREIVLQEIGSLAGASNHPNAQAVKRAMLKAKLSEVKIIGAEEIHGKGLQGKCEGKTIYLGRPEWVAEKLALSELSHDEAKATLAAGKEGEGFLAFLTLEDTLREDASRSLQSLRDSGVKKITLLTGDSLEVAEKVGQSIGFDEVLAKCLPEDKLRHLNHAISSGALTSVVGDGINDAPMLAAGHVGIAMGALGSQVAIESSSITLMSSSLDRLPFLHRLSRTTKWMIWSNITMGMCVVFLGLALAIMGVFNPIGAAILNTVGALLILFNSARLVKLTPEP